MAAHQGPHGAGQGRVGLLGILDTWAYIWAETDDGRKLGYVPLDVLTDVALVLVALYSGRGIYLDIAIVTAILGFLSQVLIGKYLEGTL